MSIKNASFSTNFRFEFDNKDYRSLNDEIISCSLPGLTLGTIEKRYKGAPVNLPGDTITINDLTLTFKNDNMYLTWKLIFEWILANYVNSNLIVSSSTLYLLSRKDEPLFSISMNNIFPYMISDIENTRIINSPEIQTFTATFKINQIAINSEF